MDVVRLRIVSVNDVYLLANLPRLASLVRHVAENDPADRLLVFVAGDFLSPSLLSSLDRGRGMVDCLDALGVTHVTFGNHENDLAISDLVDRTRELRAKWLATNVPELNPALPSSDIVEVAGTRIGLIGVVMVDPAVYPRPPFGGTKVYDPVTRGLEETRRLIQKEGCAFVLPLTHQFLAADRALAEGAYRLGRPYPVICGGHEHEPVIEKVAGAMIVKAGDDAHRAAVIDIVLGPDGPETRVRLERVADFPEDAEMRARVDRHLTPVRALEEATLLSFPGETLTSIGTRARQTSMGTLVASRVRDAFGAEGGFINGGGIRGAREHHGALTYGALEAEIPFDNEVVIARLPGRVIADAIAYSRRHAPRESGGFLQVDDGMTVTEGHVLTHVAGAPLDPERDYAIALVREMLCGLDGIEPLVRFGSSHPERVPPPDTGRGLRMSMVHAFSVNLWKQLGGFDAVDANGDGVVTKEEVEAKLAEKTNVGRPDVVAGLVVRALDVHPDEVITRDEAKLVE